MQWELILSKHTTTDWSSYCREVCTAVCVHHLQQIGGPGVEVEIDETNVGRRKYHRGKRVEGKWIFGGCEKENSRKCFVVPVDVRDRGTLLTEIDRQCHHVQLLESIQWY